MTAFKARRDKRRRLVRPCWIGPPPIQNARLLDVSPSGARVLLEDAAAKLRADHMTLYLTRNLKVFRHCRIAWRRDKEMGLQFF
jgi:hypothetical protein